jgi:hypothetical protein
LMQLLTDKWPSILMYLSINRWQCGQQAPSATAGPGHNSAS